MTGAHTPEVFLGEMLRAPSSTVCVLLEGEELPVRVMSPPATGDCLPRRRKEVYFSVIFLLGIYLAKFLLLFSLYRD